LHQSPSQLPTSTNETLARHFNVGAVLHQILAELGRGSNLHGVAEAKQKKPLTCIAGLSGRRHLNSTI
jgi:hypothetical protein